MDKELELIVKALEIGLKYGQSDKPTKIQIGKLMLGKKRPKRRKKKKSL